MALEDMSWHIKYFELSFMYYICGAAALVAFYLMIYCLKMPIHKIPNLRDIIDNDPTINEGLFEIIRSVAQQIFILNNNNPTDS
jgi:hypothetical protein